MRRKHDQYFTPAFASHELLKHIDISRKQVFECCSGAGDISNVLNSVATVWTNDISTEFNANFYMNAAEENFWTDVWNDRFDWVISNPPFNQAPQIVPHAFRFARVGIAMLLRLSYLEPCFNGKSDRAAWLSVNPPNKLVVLPRISFTGNGKTDNVTCAWMIWEKDPNAAKYIRVVPR